MITLKGKIEYKTFAAGTKSESVRPYLCFENGTQILLYKKNDNPFENKGFTEYTDLEVSVEGDLENGTFVVENILTEDSSTETDSENETSEKEND